MGDCYRYSASYEYYFECNGTNSVIVYQFTDGSCNTEDQSAYYSYTYDDSSDTSGIFQCDQQESCKAAILRYYYDDDCNGESYYDYPFITTECYSSSTTSYELGCDGDTLSVASYSSSDDCKGDATTASLTFDSSYSESFTGCYKVCHVFLFYFDF